MKQQAKRKLSELFELCVELNKPDFTVFFDFAGHIDHIQINIHFGGWKRLNDSDHDISVYTDTNDDSIIDYAHKAKFELIDIHNKFRSEK